MSVYGQRTVVADSLTRRPLPGASVFDRNGNALGIGAVNGSLPYIAPGSYPVTVRYLGYEERELLSADVDTVFMVENSSELPEVVVESRNHKVLHVLAYVREYSTLSTYTDTVFMFREKMVDYMLTPGWKTKFKGWSRPRVLSSKSYYRFTDVNGLDSVSDVSNWHFSWSDWMGLTPSIDMPTSLRDVELATDTIFGKYSPSEIWRKGNSRIEVDVDVLADTAARRWVPGLSLFFKDDLEFEHFKVKLNYDNTGSDAVAPIDMAGYSFNIESNGRGHEMFMFNKVDQSVFVSTYGEVYILDKEYITEKEARKWTRHDLDLSEIGILEADNAPELQPLVMALVERVNNIDRDKIRIELPPDQRLVSPHFGKSKHLNMGYRALSMLKNLVGISSYKLKRNTLSNWNKFKKQQIRRNAAKQSDENKD